MHTESWLCEHWAVCASGGGAQTQAINLVSKTKILLTHSSLQQKVSPSITSSHLGGQLPGFYSDFICTVFANVPRYDF